MKTSRAVSFLLSGALLVALPASSVGQTTPPMGWNSWNYFGLIKNKPPSDTIIRAQAEAMVRSGMKAVGYTYVNIDDEWQGGRDSEGNIRPDPINFPHGMAALADYVHSLGLKIGIYSSPGKLSCAKRVGSYGHEQQDANTFASWGIDYLKYDWCSATGDPPTVFQLMSTALQNTNRPIIYSISNYGIDQPWMWGTASGANLWRVSPDVKDDFYIMAETGFGDNGLETYAGPTKGWNDADMLQIGNGGMNLGQYQMQMTLWCIMASPLIAGNDLTLLLDKHSKLQQEYRALLTNSDVIAVDQDPLGAQGRRVWEQGPQEIWRKTMSDGSTVVGVFNRVLGTVNVPLPFQQIGVKGTVDAYDLWAKKDLGKIQNGYLVSLGAFSAAMLKLTPIK